MDAGVIFFLRGRRAATDEAECAIYAKIEVNGQTSTAFSTKWKIPVKYWMTDGSRKIKASTSEFPVSPSYSLSDEVNSHLLALKKTVFQACQLLEATGTPVSLATVKELVLNPKPIKPPKKFIEVVDEMIEMLRAKRKEQTMLTYRTRKNNLIEFLTARGYQKLTIQEFRYHHFEEMQQWMLAQRVGDELGRKARWGVNTINKHLTMINKVLKYGVNKEYIQASPIGQMGLEYVPTAPPEYLTRPDRQRIYECKLATLEKEKDISWFLIHTGLSYTDYLTLEDDHLHRLPSGEFFIKKPRDKSEIYSIIPLMTEAHEVISKYGGVSKLPRPDISDLNKALKILGEVSKSPYSLSTSTFRETFSSMMENEFMVPERLLMFMMGHTNPRQLRNYSRVMPARILHELKKNEIIIPFNLSAYEALVKAS